ARRSRAGPRPPTVAGVGTFRPRCPPWDAPSLGRGLTVWGRASGHVEADLDPVAADLHAQSVDPRLVVEGAVGPERGRVQVDPHAGGEVALGRLFPER